MKTKAYNSNVPGLLLMALFVFALLAACSGGNIDVAIGGGNVPPGSIPPFQNTESISSQGTVTGLADLTVNGVQYDADGALVTIDSEPATLSDIRIGHFITLTGRINTLGFAGTASAVRLDSRVIGPIESVDAVRGRLTVLGQTIRVGSDTHYTALIDPDTLDGLAPGQRVRISGYADAAGATIATRVEPANAGATVQLIGKVSGLDPGTLAFRINQQAVNYSSAVLIDLPGGAPANGMTIRVTGTLSNGSLAAGQLATAPALTGTTGRRVQLGGVITRFASMGDFEVNGTGIAANFATRFSSGDSGDLAPDAAVVVDGTFASGGRIQANRITFGRYSGMTTTLDYDLSGFTEISVPTVFGITVTQGAAYSVGVIVDEEAGNRVSVTRSGSRLTIALQPGNGRIDTLEAHVTMPALERIDLTGTVHALLRGFDQPQMTINVGGVSYLAGDALRIGQLSAAVTGVSLLNLGDIRPIGRADITVSGVSQATLNMAAGSTLSGSVSTGQGTGASVLYYYGTNVATNVTTGWNASLIRLGDTKP